MEAIPPAVAVCEPIIADGRLRYWGCAFDPRYSDRLLLELRQGIEWQQEEILIFGRRRLVPRLVAWHGDPLASYTYSGTRHEPRPWTAPLLEIRARIEALTGAAFNSVLLNLYRDGRDSMGWHSDDEPELGRDPQIASVSFGATRRFRLQHRRRKTEALNLDLGHGSLLLMSGETQHHWRHCVPKTTVRVGERINLTFRRIWPSGPQD
ncbi:MAG TPA: alpha-ketoglutarate-dependent dioxygenase AlkB [Steroidobacteraceae bacterium]|nr:alpha-ketoglutarate-dependent dioxygenase AlkB [Steroidobacteraceae bacterium]